MTSQKSFINNFGYAYRTGLRDNAAVALMQFLLGAIAFIYAPAKILFQKVTSDQSTGKIALYNIKNDYKFILTSNMEYTRYLYIAAFLIIGVLMGIVTFKFMTGKKTMNVYYSLGIKRTHLFCAKYLSGLTLIAISTFVPIFVGFILNIAKIGFSSNLLLSALFYFLAFLSLSAFSFSLTAMVFSAVGTAFEGLVFSGIIISMPSIIISSIQSFIEKLVPGSPYGIMFSSSGLNSSQESLSHKLSILSPFMYPAKGIFEYMSADPKGQILDYDSGKTVAWSAPDFSGIILWSLIAATLFVCAIFVYEHRKAEIGGFIGKNKLLNFICTFTLGFFGFVSAYSLGSAFSKPIRITVAFGVFAIIYIVLDLLLIRNFKEFIKGFYKLPIHLGIAAVIFVFFATGYFGVANKTPDISKIANIQITSGYTNYSADTNISSNYYSMSNVNLSGCKYPSGKYETENDKNKIIAIHKALTKRGLLTMADAKDNLSDVFPMYIKIVYNLDNGKQIKRAYYGFSQEIYNMLLDIDKSDYRTARLKDTFFGKYKSEEEYTEDDIKAYKVAFQNNDKEFMFDFDYNLYKAALQNDNSSVWLYNKSGTGTEVSLTSEQHKELLNHLYNDISSMTPEQLYNPTETYCILGFRSEPYLFTTINNNSNGTEVSSSMYSESFVSSDKIQDVNENIYRVNSTTQPDFYLTPDMKETVSYLKAIGVFDSAITANSDISEVRVTKISDVSSMYFSNGSTYNFELGKEILFQNTGSGGSWQYKSTDKNVINKLYSVALLRHTINIDEDYIVYFKTGEDNFFAMCIDGSQLPEDIKQSVEKNQINYSFGE